MPYKDLRDFLTRLASEGQLLRVDREVLPEPDISAAAYAAGEIPNGPAILFEKIRGYDRKKVVMNVHGSWRNYALMLDLPIDTPLQQIFHELVKRSERFPVPSRRVESAPLKETILTKNINLFEVLPVFRVNDYDGGPYLSKAVVVSKDPENPKNQNVGIYRLQVKDRDRLPKLRRDDPSPPFQATTHNPVFFLIPSLPSPLGTIRPSYSHFSGFQVFVETQKVSKKWLS